MMNVRTLGAAAAMIGAASVISGVISVPAAAQDSALIASNLLGQEVPHGAGDDKASADFDGQIDLKKNTLCYYLDMFGLADATAVHLHHNDQAGADTPTLALKLPASDGDEVCVDADHALLAAIAKKPDDYYIDIHTPGHIDGSVRGSFKK